MGNTNVKFNKNTDRLVNSIIHIAKGRTTFSMSKNKLAKEANFCDSGASFRKELQKLYDLNIIEETEINGTGKSTSYTWKINMDNLNKIIKTPSIRPALLVQQPIEVATIKTEEIDIDKLFDEIEDLLHQTIGCTKAQYKKVVEENTNFKIENETLKSQNQGLISKIVGLKNRIMDLQSL